MKKIQTSRWVLVMALLVLGGTMGRTEEFAIQSFDATGKLSFNRLATAETYRVEWAPTPGGPWTSFTGATTVALASIPQFAMGSYTCSVPMCYRVVVAAMHFKTMGERGTTEQRQEIVNRSRRRRPPPGR